MTKLRKTSSFLAVLLLASPISLWAQSDSGASSTTGSASTKSPASSSPAPVSNSSPAPGSDSAALSGDQWSSQDLSIKSDELNLDIPQQTNKVSKKSNLALSDQDTITLDIPNEDIRTVLRNVADLYGINIVIPDTLVGTTSIKLRDVTWEQVFRVILEPIGYTYVKENNIIKIKTLQEIAAEPVRTEPIPVRYAPASSLVASIQPMLDKEAGGTVQADKRTNVLLVTERPSRLETIKGVVARLDSAEAQIMIESKFIEIQNSDQKQLGINWASLAAYSPSVGPIARNWTKDSSKASTTPGKENFAGATYTDTFTNNEGRSDTAVFTAPQFQAILSALNNLNGTKVISNPTLVTMNNTESLISIGTQRPLPQYNFNNDTGTFMISGFTYIDIGVNLRVTPTAQQDLITLKIKPEISSSDQSVNFTVGQQGIAIPVIKSARTESVVTIQNGCTIAIGGLIEDNKIHRGTSVPGLGRVPVLGHLFRSKDNTDTRRNIVIFVTATQVGYDGAIQDPKSVENVHNMDPRMFFEMGLNATDLPGYKVSQEQMNEFDAVKTLRQRDSEQRLMEQSVGVLGAEIDSDDNSVMDVKRTNRIHRRNR